MEECHTGKDSRTKLNTGRKANLAKELEQKSLLFAELVSTKSCSIKYQESQFLHITDTVCIVFIACTLNHLHLHDKICENAPFPFSFSSSSSSLSPHSPSSFSLLPCTPSSSHSTQTLYLIIHPSLCWNGGLMLSICVRQWWGSKGKACHSLYTPPSPHPLQLLSNKTPESGSTQP